MPWKSEHYRAALANAAVRLSIDSMVVGARRDGEDQLFEATDMNGVSVVVAIDGSAWDSLVQEFGCDALSELEQLALTGGWESYGEIRVWRVILI